MTGFAELIAPLEPAVFFQYHWETKPLFLLRSQPGRFSDIFALPVVDSILWNLAQPKEPPGARVSLLINGQRLPASVLSSEEEEGVRPEAILRQIAAGATLLIEHIQWCSTPLSALCRDLERSFGAAVSINLYLTPESSQGFPLHFDFHDVFILQVSGEKVWRVHGAPVTLPMPGMRSVVVPSDSETVEVLDVREGTVLYIPRGFLHEARTGTAHSVHLTVGIKTPTWSDLLREALADVATHDPRFRHALPLDLHRADRPETTELQFRSLVQAFAEHADLARAVERCNARGSAVVPPIAAVIGACIDEGVQ